MRVYCAVAQWSVNSVPVPENCGPENKRVEVNWEPESWESES